MCIRLPYSKGLQLNASAIRYVWEHSEWLNTSPAPNEHTFGHAYTGDDVDVLKIRQSFPNLSLRFMEGTPVSSDGKPRVRLKTARKKLGGIQRERFGSEEANIFAGQLFNMESLDGSESLPFTLRSRLYELFSQIEKEFEALYVENMSLHTRVEALTDRLTEGGLPLEKAAEIFAITSEATSSKSTIGKKPSIQMGQKLKTAFKVPPGRNLVSSFKVGSDQNRVRFVRAFKGHRDGVWHVDAAATGVICSTSADQTARIWCAETGACFAQYLGHEGSVNCARFAPTTVGGGHEILVLSASGDQSAHVWKAPTAFVGSQTGSGHQSNFILPHSSEDEKFSDKEENVLDENDNYVIIRTPQLRLTGHTAPVVAADWLWTQNRIVTASWDRTAIVFDSERGEIVNILSGHDLELNHCCAHPSQNLIVTASKDTTFRLWDFRESIHSVAVFQGHIESVTSVVFTGGDKIVSGSDDRSVKVWDFRNMRTALSTVRLDSPVNRIAISRSNGLIAIPTDNRQVRLYDLAGTRITRLPSTSRRGHHRMVCCCAWADESSNCNLFTCGFDKLVLGWNVSIGQSKDKE